MLEALRETQFLLVDRHGFMRRILRSLLLEGGARNVVELGDAAAFFDAVETYRPGLILLDTDMRPFDGPELVWHLRRLGDEGLRKVPVIVMAAGATLSMVNRAKNFGCDEFLCKPISAKSLRVRLKSALMHRREFIEAPNYVGPCRRRFVNPLFEGDERRGGGGSPLDFFVGRDTVLLG